MQNRHMISYVKSETKNPASVVSLDGEHRDISQLLTINIHHINHVQGFTWEAKISHMLEKKQGIVQRWEDQLKLQIVELNQFQSCPVQVHFLQWCPDLKR
jgi:hypothetical protein